ncbi:heme NO-binding domain-containing protein [Flammeovirga sp. SJP92]|uniref:heme NO-binding domain-containing protein n=1 Tax=Flammeovirga sp. SJP92 TaxID=1775430 RepID=UPI000786CE23|nr:heme NO-binding domain-containing protein [Flammeovirga sp. SJP92]KXX71021.1 heme NO-binding protein [Flammeovirga sp. SJP92]
MYGIVNKAIEGLVTTNFGEEKWETILEESGVDHDVFSTNEIYDDKITFDLAIAASKVLGISVSDVLIAFGKYWVLTTAKKHYGSLMETGGETLKEFFVNLPNFHSRVMLLYPNIQPPEFDVEYISDSEMKLKYFSQREGLTDFVHGLILGLGEAFDIEVDTHLIQGRKDGLQYDEFLVKW